MLKETLTFTTQLEQKVRSLVPSTSGLILRPPNTITITARKIKLRYKKMDVWRKAQAYTSLPKDRKRGRPKTQRLSKKVRWMLLRKNINSSATFCNSRTQPQAKRQN